MRRLAISLLGGLLAGVAGVAMLVSPTTAEEPTAEGLAPVDVLQVSGLFDEVTVDSITDAIAAAEAGGSQALILQINTRGAVVSESTMRDLLQRVADADVAVGLWVGPAKAARVYGTPAQLFGVADATAMVAGSRIGHTGELLRLDGATIELGRGADTLKNGSMTFTDARAAGVLRLNPDRAIPDTGVPTVRSMILEMDGLVLDDGTVLDTVAEEPDAEGVTQNVATLVRFSQLGVIDEVFHTVASPPMAYLLFTIGLCLLIFEFFTAGVGVAGVVGVGSLLLGGYGLAELPARGGAVALIVVSMLAFSIDVQVGIPRFWTGVGTTLFVLGSLFLYEPLPGTSLRLGWITLIVGIGGVLLTFIVGMPSMVRTRFATPTIGRDWMIGSVGLAVEAIAPDGVAQVGEGRWRARTNRATPIAAGDELRVIAIDGVTLEVEPLEGAARDHRERRSS